MSFIGQRVMVQSPNKIWFGVISQYMPPHKFFVDPETPKVDPQWVWSDSIEFIDDDYKFKYGY